MTTTARSLIALAKLGHLVIEPQVQLYEKGVLFSDVSDKLLPESYIQRDTCRVGDNAVAKLFLLLDRTTTPHWPATTVKISFKVHDAASPSNVLTMPMGTYWTDTPKPYLAEDPPTWEIDCHDIITAANTLHTSTITFSATTTIASAFTTVANLLTGVAVAPELADNAAMLFGSATMGAERIWPLATRGATLLGMLDHVLEVAGWRPPWTDQEGRLVTQIYRDPVDEPIVADINLESATDPIRPGASVKIDTFGSPTHAVFIGRDGVTTTRTLADSHPGSQASRGRKITEIVQIDAEGAQFTRVANRLWLGMTTSRTTLCFAMPPIPLFWHRDLLTISADSLDIVPQSRFFVRSWRLPLDGKDMVVTVDSIED